MYPHGHATFPKENDGDSRPVRLVLHGDVKQLVPAQGQRRVAAGRCGGEGQPRIAQDALQQVRQENIGGGAIVHARALLAPNVAVAADNATTSNFGHVHPAPRR